VNWFRAESILTFDQQSFVSIERQAGAQPPSLSSGTDDDAIDGTHHFRLERITMVSRLNFSRLVLGETRCCSHHQLGFHLP